MSELWKDIDVLGDEMKVNIVLKQNLYVDVYTFIEEYDIGSVDWDRFDALGVLTGDVHVDRFDKLRNDTRIKTVTDNQDQAQISR